MKPNTTWVRRILILAAGAIQTLTYAPFKLWPFGILSAAIAFYIIRNESKKRESTLLGWLFGFGIFGSGASWVYVSIHDHGAANMPLALLMTFLFVAFLALFHAFQFRVFYAVKPVNRSLLTAIVFSSVWILTDWFRSWFLTGFPWLYLGHGHIISPLSSLAPLGGIHTITWAVVFSGACLALLGSATSHQQRVKSLAPAITIWAIALLFGQITWTNTLTDTPMKVAVVQGNIPQELKWDPEHRVQTILTYQALSNNYWGYDIILWPETAIPILVDQATTITEPLAKFAKENKTTLITGIPYQHPYKVGEPPTYHNSITSLGNGEGLYHKQKLVPFGEYVPLESMLRGLIEFFNLPMSSFSAGQDGQAPLTAGNHKVSPFICYEVVYPEFVAKAARESDLLLTISNDAWFGGSIGPHQHLEIAQMRALETGRYMIRGTNSGISAIINSKGKIVEKSPQFQEYTLSGLAYPSTGQTPFMLWLSWPILLLSLGSALISLRLTSKDRAAHKSDTD